MNAESAVEEAVRDLLGSRSPLARSLAELPGDLRLGPGGLGLDSIALVELFLDCEQRFGLGGIGGAAAELLAGPPLTIDRLVAYVRAVVAP
jgi:acyl carrier protein